MVDDVDTPPSVLMFSFGYVEDGKNVRFLLLKFHTREVFE